MSGINLLPALQAAKLTVLEQIALVDRKRANPARHTQESINLAEGRIPDLKLLYFITECVLANRDWHATIQAHLAVKGYVDVSSADH